MARAGIDTSAVPGLQMLCCKGEETGRRIGKLTTELNPNRFGDDIVLQYSIH